MIAWQTIGAYLQYGNSRGNLCPVRFKFNLDTPQKAVFCPKKRLVEAILCYAKTIE